MKLLYIYLEEDYKHIPKGGYYFNREFKIEFDINSKKIDFTTNESYHKPFNYPINNISCIVGKNGMGKTTFFEILLAPLLGKLDENTSLKNIHFLFYDEDEIEKKFYIYNSNNNYSNWEYLLDGKSIEIFKNIKDSIKPQNKNIEYLINDNGYSTLPYQMNIIFHSLSPFDRIHTFLKNKLLPSSQYKRHFKYIGVNQILINEIKYESMTIANLINLFFYEHSKKMINDLGYHFEKIVLNINQEYFNHKIIIPDYGALNQNLINEEIYRSISNKINHYYENSDFYSQEIDNSLINFILFNNLKIDSENNFIHFIELVKGLSSGNDFSTNLENILNNLEHYIEHKKLFDSKTYDFLVDLVKNKENFFKLNDLKEEDKLKVIIENEELAKLLENLKKLIIRDIIKFSINLKKSKHNKNCIDLKNNENIIDFFRLSSGEKTLLSYFANIMARINELRRIQKKDNTYNNVLKKTFLILIDEVELHLHPEWQRIFIKKLNDFFILKDSIKLQFIIATHSPFVVSDMYNDNIIYLGEKGNLNTKTFGGNIFDIFKDDFYVKNTIGAFSEEIIKELSEFLYFLFGIKKAIDGNFFIIRDFLEIYYKDKNDKENENKKLLSELKLIVKNNINDLIYIEDINKIENNSYFIKYIKFKNKESPSKEIDLIIGNIGEEVVKNHLKSMFDEVKSNQILKEYF